MKCPNNNSRASAAQELLDVVIWGASGFTGQLACAYLSKDPTKFFSYALRQVSNSTTAVIKWGVAGRNKSKLQAVLRECNAPKDVQLFVVEAHDEEAIQHMVSRTRVVCAMAGPFAKYSTKVLAACAQSGTHYVDICGEVVWVRSCMDRYNHVAQATRACIVNFCGYDSIPSDLGTWYAVTALRNKYGPNTIVKSVKCYQIMYSPTGGGFSGGSLQTGLVDKPTLTSGVDPESPFLLGGETPGDVRRPMDQFQTKAQWDEDLNCWVAPFVMERVNAVATRRSAAYLEYGSPSCFNYQEVAVAPNEAIAKKMAYRTTHPVPPHRIQKMIDAGRLPKPGQGPLPKDRANMAFLSLFVAKVEDGKSISVAVRGGEPGYEETAKMVVESALALALHPAECPGYAKGGFQSTAMCMGAVLIQRLQAAEIQFYEVANPQQEIMEFWQSCQQKKRSLSNSRL